MNNKISHTLLRLYAILFLLYLLLPLLVMGAAAFNDSRFPSPLPWQGFTWRWFIELYNDETMWEATGNTLLVAIAVVALAVPIGTAGAILVNSVKGRSRTLLYATMIAPVLTPGAVIGISTLLFWYKIYYPGLALDDGAAIPGDLSWLSSWTYFFQHSHFAWIQTPAGLHLSVLGQTSFIAAYVMLMVLARLQSFDGALEEAALDLGASHSQMLRRILLPHLYPAILAGAVLAFFQSVENFNTTQFTRGSSTTLTVYVGSKVRSGITPTINALAVIMITLTIIGVIAYEINRRRVEARNRALNSAAS